MNRGNWRTPFGQIFAPKQVFQFPLENFPLSLLGWTPMPLLWRYFASHYFRIFSLCLMTFVGVLLVTRFQEIARFATLSSQIGTTALFILYQIPLILPLAIPLSCAIAGFLLLLKISRSQELTAIRACGLSLKEILFPILLSGFFLSLLNFTFLAQLSPRSRQNSQKLIHEMTHINPLFLLHKDALGRMKNIYTQMGSIEAGKRAEEVLFVCLDTSKKRLCLLSAEELSIENGNLEGKKVTILSPWEGESPDWFDNLLLEKEEKMAMRESSLPSFLQNEETDFGYDYSTLSQLLQKENEESSFSLLRRRPLFELSKRLSLALAPFSFTLVGASFGISLGRKKSSIGPLLGASNILFFLFCFLGARSMRHNPYIATMIVLLPHPVLLLSSLFWLKTVNQGKVQ